MVERSIAFFVAWCVFCFCVGVVLRRLESETRPRRKQPEHWSPSGSRHYDRDGGLWL